MIRPIETKTHPALCAFISLTLLWPANAATIGELGILQGSANGGINPATGSPWQTGDQYRLAFVTSGTRNATSPNISDYDAFVQSAANTAGLGAATWRCVGQSMNNPSAQTNTGTSGGAGVGIFLLDGTTKIADNYADLWNNSIDSKWNLTEKLTTYEGTVASGSSRKFGDTTQSKIEHGNCGRTDGAWWQVYNGNQTSQWHFYALSDPLTVVNGGPDTNPPVLVSTDPADNSSGFPINEPLVAVFDETIFPGTGNITIRRLSGSGDTTISINDASQVTISGKTLTINPTVFLLPSIAYAIRIDHGAIRDYVSQPYAGISDDSTWNFTTGADSFITALEELADHITATITLSTAQIAAHKLTIDTEKHRLDESTATITAAFDLITTYDTTVSPLWVNGSPVQEFNRDNTNPTDVKSVSNENIHWIVYSVMQYLMDEVYNAATLADPAKRALLDGFKFGSTAEFPGAVSPPATPSTHTATISASFPNSFGRETQQWTLPARKPTGCYLAPGSIATVEAPPALVGQGIKVRVGAHSWDLSSRAPVKRLERATILYDLDATEIKISSPYGGGIYLEIPMGLELGVASVDITGAVRSPLFSVKPFHTTTNAEWIATERNHPAPWADFQSEKFMMQVPTTWIFALNDPASTMADWDDAMDAINDLMGFPRTRGKETMYVQPDVILRSSVHAPGYPAVNVTYTYNPASAYNGNQDNYLVRGPGASPTAANIEFHEQGHAYFFPKFGGETESNVNLLQPAMLHRKFGYSFDVAHAGSLGSSNASHTIDNTAVAWMCCFNFSPNEQPMAQLEKQYQFKGHAKFMDIARLFGWEGLDDYWRSFMEDDAASISYANTDDEKLLRLSRSVGKDLRPLFHFWGVHPQNPPALAASITAENIPASPEIRDLLLRYKTLVPADNAAFHTFALNWWGKKPSVAGYWEETDHAMQWDETLDADGSNNPNVRPNGSIYVEASATEIRARVQELVDLYFPLETTPPVLTSNTIADDKGGGPATVSTLVTYTVTFSEDMDASTVSAADFGNAGSATVTIGTVTETTPGVFTVPVTPTSAGTLQLKVNAGAELKDVAGNALATASAITDDTTITVIADYTTWAGGAAFDADTNNDGVANGLAWLLGAANPSADASALLPKPTNEAAKLVLAFRCLKTTLRGSAVLMVQYSNDLGQTDLWTNHEALVPDADGTVGNTVFDTTPDADPSFINVRAEIPASAASSAGKLFGRLYSTGN